MAVARRRRWPRVGSIVFVEWDDAWQSANDHESERLPTETVGWLIKRTRRSIYVAAERFPDQTPITRWRGVTRIPIGMVDRVVTMAGP